MKIEENFSVHINEFGIIISAPISLEILPRLMELFNDLYGFDLCDSLIASHFKASVCLTTKFLSDKWRNELNLES